ncbi:hypothetical protein J1779_07925 [Rahnella sp. FC061912-K]|uniref:hypothetical protein n=1 Tax=Rahnella rivi TaxID=2816249 RepID=UPI001C270063|nr:hypothetical protein [Rahnella rivi]MBU9829858.1 hypothetical protein [Rahnella rivi]
MNNDLEQFSEERLKYLSTTSSIKNGATAQESAALARIALAAKQAKPVAQVYQPANIGICAALGPAIRMINVGLPAGALLYTTPQPAHTEQDGCQWNPDEDAVYSTSCGNEWQFTDGGLEDNQIKFCPYCSGKIAAPKPESEL